MIQSKSPNSFLVTVERRLLFPTPPSPIKSTETENNKINPKSRGPIGPERQTNQHKIVNCGRPWPAAYLNIIQNTHQIQVLTEPLCLAQAIFYSLPMNEWGTKYRGLTYSAK